MTDSEDNPVAEDFFTNQGSTEIDMIASDVELADLDGDGDKDMIISNELWDKTYIHWNDGSGNFTKSDIEMKKAWNVETYDIDEDGDLDLLVSGYQTDNSILINDSGTFTNLQQDFGNRAVEIKTVDANNDGNKDILVSGQFPDQIDLYLSNGDETYSDPINIPALTDHFPADFSIGDFNGDLLDDLLFLANDGVYERWTGKEQQQPPVIYRNYIPIINK